MGTNKSSADTKKNQTASKKAHEDTAKSKSSVSEKSSAKTKSASSEKRPAKTKSSSEEKTKTASTGKKSASSEKTPAKTKHVSEESAPSKKAPAKSDPEKSKAEPGKKVEQEASRKSTPEKTKAATEKKSADSSPKKKSSPEDENSTVRFDIDSVINKENIKRVAEIGAKAKSPKKRAIFISVAIAMTVLFGAWFLGGKPYVEFGADGVLMSVVQAEDPLIYRPADILDNWFEYDAARQQNQIENQQNETIHQASYTTEVTPVRPSSTNTKKDSEPSQADLGYSENNPLFFGNPTDAYSENACEDNYLMVKPQYTLSYNTKTLCPNWVAWHLNSSDIGPSDRMNDFRPDPELPGDWHAIRKADYHYNSYGFDRGHVCPSADRTATKEDNSMTFLMTNMVPQSPDNNRVIWMHFENYERTLVAQGNEVYIIAGPYGTGGTSSKGTFDSISVKTRDGGRVEMNVPAYTWKVLIAIPEGTDDLNRIDEDATVIAINVPNQMGMGKTGDWEQFLCSVDYIEALTGYDFFELLPDKIEEKIESKVYEYIK